MNYKFKSIKYNHENNGNVNICFIGEDSVLLFSNCVFNMIDLHEGPCSNDCRHFDVKGMISSIKQTEDFDYIIKLADDRFMKIFYMPSDAFGLGVEQVLLIYDKNDSFYKNIEKEFFEIDETIGF